MPKKTVAVFSKGYFPGKRYGGPVTSLYNFSELFGNELNIYVICSNHDLGGELYLGIQEGWNIVGQAKVKYLADKFLYKTVFENILNEIRPDIIYASSIFSALFVYPLFSLSAKYRIPLLLAPRGELLQEPMKTKALKKRVYLAVLKVMKKLDNVFFQATSEMELNGILLNLGIKKEKVFFLPNIPVVPIRKNKIKKERYKVKICFVGRITEHKNLLIAIEAAIKSRVRVIFDIYGAQEDISYWNTCKMMIDKTPPNVIIKYVGVLSPIEMRRKYKEYDVLISPTPFENYGHAIVEAMMHDVPVIISKGTTPWDDIQDMNAGFCVPLMETDSFTKAIDEIGEMNEIEYIKLVARLRKYCERRFDYDLIKRNYMNVFSKLIQKNEADCNYAI